jgi:hypothetical protein
MTQCTAVSDRRASDLLDEGTDGRSLEILTKLSVVRIVQDSVAAISDRRISAAGIDRRYNPLL